MKYHRPRKHDRFTASDANPGDTAAHYALAPFDEAVRAAEREWGVDRLPGLVSPEMAARWGTAMEQLNAAIASKDVNEITARVGVCLRGLAAMQKEAEERGAQRSNPQTWEMTDGEQFKFAILRDGRDWPKLKASRPDLLFFTEREVVNAMKAYHSAIPAIDEIRKHFPDAKVGKIKSPVGEMVDDEIIW